MVKTSKKKMVKGSVRLKDPEPNKPYKFFNLQKIVEVTRIQPDKVYNNFKGAYHSFTDEEKKQIATCLMLPIKNVFESLGMTVSFSKLQENGSE